MKKIDEYLNRTNWEEKENANIGFSVQGLNASIFKRESKEYWLNKVYTKEIRDAHKSGVFHISDLGGLTSYCMGLDLKDLLTVGFTGVKGKLSCKPPKHFRSALGQAINFLFSVQQEVMGAVALSNFDTLLAPFIAVDNLTYKEVKQGIQEFVYSCNVATRVAGETPFINLSFDINVPKSMLEEPIIIGGERHKRKTYGDFQNAMDMINRAFCECMLEGDGDGKPFSFPIPTYSITKDFNWDDPRHDIIFKLAGKYGNPYFSNYINSDLDPDEITSMCPFIGSQKVFAKVNGFAVHNQLRDLYRRKQDNLYIPFKGMWVKAKVVRFPYKDKPFYKITLRNGMSYTTTDEHLNVTSRGNVTSKDLVVGDKFEYV